MAGSGRTVSASTAVAATSLLLLLLLTVSGALVTAAATSSSSSSASSKDDDDTCRTENHSGGDDVTDVGQRRRPAMTVDFHPNDHRLLLYHFESTTSTQDEAKVIAESLSQPSSDEGDDTTVKTFCVTATSQTNGRGTSGRQWMGEPGNVFVTIGIPIKTWMGLRDDVMKKNIPLTLLPLKVGDLVASQVQSLIDQECGTESDAVSSSSSTTAPIHPPMVTVKWPNDVLVNDKKISGTLIESAHDWFLIGIGINWAHAPAIPTSGSNHGRPSVSIQDICPKFGNDENGDIYRTAVLDKAHEAGIQLAYDLHTWLDRHSTATQSSDTISAHSIVNGWKRWLDWDMEWTMRDTPSQERVRIINVLPDGRIQVSNVVDGTERILVSDYFV